MSANLYDAEFYASRKPLRPEFDAMGRVLAKVFDPAAVLDCGCGPGEIITAMGSMLYGTKCLGLDASVEAFEAFVGSGIAGMIVADITKSTMRGDFDLVLCLETAEHIPESSADSVAIFVAGNTSKWLVWSSATPGQGGTGHVNEQPTEYWTKKLYASGLLYHPEMTKCMRLLFAAAAPRQPWYGKTTMVFERAR